MNIEDSTLPLHCCRPERDSTRQLHRRSDKGEARQRGEQVEEPAKQPKAPTCGVPCVGRDAQPLCQLVVQAAAARAAQAG